MEFLNKINELQEAAIADSAKKKSKDNEYHFDKLKMYFGEDFTYKGITISMPTIGNILEIGESNFFKSLSPFLYNSTSIRVLLWDNGIDWNNVKDIEVFDIMRRMQDEKSGVNLLFKGISLDDFKLLAIKPEDDSEKQMFLYDESMDFALSEDDFMVIASYIREMLNIHPKIEKAKGKTAKSWIIQEDKLNASQEEERKNSSTLLPLISSCINHPGFKYKLQELRDVGIYQFMDSVKRIQKYENGISALRGCYSGFVDGSKIDKEILNFMGDI